MRSEGYCSWVCVSVMSHLTYGASVRPENAVTYSAGNEGQTFVGFSLKPLRCRDPALPPLCGRAYIQSAIFPAESTHAHYSVYHVVDRSCPVWWCREDGCEIRELPLIMPPSKVCPQCNAVVPIRLKVCKSCQHVFRAKRQIGDSPLYVGGFQSTLEALRFIHATYRCLPPSYPSNAPRVCTSVLSSWWFNLTPVCSYMLSENILCHSTVVWGFPCLVLYWVVDLNSYQLSCPGSSNPT